jgi:membrane protease YdiL (CAAX protease family)
LFLSRRTFKAQQAPGPADALLVIALLFPINFYFSSLLARHVAVGGAAVSWTSVVVMVLLPQVLVLFGLPLFASWYLRLNLQSTFMWRLPRSRALLAGTFLGCSSWILALQFVAWQNTVWEIPRSPAFEELGAVVERLPTVLILFLFALTPAICEEHLFRGFLLSGLRGRRGKLFCILVVGAIFGAFHLPLFRQPVTFLLGVSVAFLAWEARSIWPGILFHFLHNGLSVLAADKVHAEGVDPKMAIGVAPKPEFVMAAALVFVVGLLLARGSGHEDRQGA